MNSPFNEQHYNELLEGLEISEVLLSDIKKDNEEFRIDDGYYKKEYLDIYKKINNYVQLKDIVSMSDVSSNGSFRFVQDTLNDNYPKVIPYIRSGNVGETFINSNDLIKISQEAHSVLKLSVTKLYDVMMARKGKIGGASIITERETNFNCNENVIKLSIEDKEKYNPFYFTAFFNSKYGLKQVERLSTGNVQPWLSIFQIRKLRLAVLPLEFQKEIETILIEAHEKLVKSEELYICAETSLLKALSINDWHPSNLSSNVKSMKESFQATGRLDAEYYQIKYDGLFEKLSRFDCDVLSDIVKVKKSVEPGSEAYQDHGIPFVRVSDLSKFGVSKPDIFLSSKDYDIEKLKPRKDTILLSKDGSVGIAYKIDEDLNCITSGAILHLNVYNPDYDPDYLTLVLNSPVVQMQAARDAGGSIIQHWKPSEIEQVIIPKLPKSIQDSIAEKIQESFRLRAESKRLLEEAKLMVENEIESIS